MKIRVIVRRRHDYSVNQQQPYSKARPPLARRSKGYGIGDDVIVRCGRGGLSTNLGVSPRNGPNTEEMTMLMNEHFIQSEVEYLRQQRLATAADHRLARSGARWQSWRSRLASSIRARRSHQDQTAQAA